MTRQRIIGLLLAGSALVFAAAPAHAQGGRNDQVNRASAAYGNFDSPGALRLLKTALDPSLAPPDSVWDSGVQLLAQILIEDGKEPLASTWLRWAFRQHPALRIDSVTYLPAVLTAANAARRATLGGLPGDAVTTTRFQWPAGISTDTMGWFRTPTATLPVPVRVLVEGVGLLGANQNLALKPGTYNIQALADGYVTARIAREILPGTTTIMQFALRSTAIAAADTTLAGGTRSRAEQQVVRLTAHRFGSENSCGAAAFVSKDGLVLTTYQAIRGAEALDAEFADGAPVRTGITVAAYDVRRNIAVLKLPVTRTDSLVPSQDVADGDFAWGLGFTGCQTAAIARVRIGSWTDRPTGILQLSDSLTIPAQGGPLINKAGSVVGLSAAERSAVPGLHAADVIAQARRNLAARPPLATLAEVARKENHLYGSLLIRSSVAGARVRATPLETWQWPDLRREGPVPLTFAGPAGRYQLELLIGGVVRQQTPATIVPGTQTPVSMDALLAQAQAAPATPSGPVGVQAKKGSSKLPFILLGGGGAAAAAVVLLMPKSSPPVDTTTPPGSTGGISVHIPVN